MTPSTKPKSDLGLVVSCQAGNLRGAASARSEWHHHGGSERARQRAGIELGENGSIFGKAEQQELATG